MTETDALLVTIRLAAEFLEGVADKADDWAEESRKGGWSTHQVEDNRDLANRCRRQAAHLKRIEREASDAR